MNIPIDQSPANNIIAINPESQSELEIILKERFAKRKCCGRCRRVECDSERRMLLCRDCGFVIDPYDYVEQWAVEGKRRMEALKDMDIMVRVASAEHEDLKRKISNLRQTLKRNGHPQPEAEKAHWHHLHLNPRIAEKELPAKVAIPKSP